MSHRGFVRVVMLVGVTSVNISLSSAVACSCVSSKETAREVRQYVQSLYDGAENIVLLRAVKVTEVGDSHEQAELRVIESWKGRFSVGDIVRSDTRDIGAGMCDAPVRIGEEIFVTFKDEPLRISGCPDDFILSKLERKYLKRLRVRKQATLAEPNKALQRTLDDSRR